MLEPGVKAPAFALTSDSGETIRLADPKGKTVILYFYPKDDTSGCTTEACDFRDNWKAILDAGAVVLGVSPDDAASHGRFRRKYSLPFPLLVDQDHRVADAYGAWGEKSMYGRKYQGILRSTFIIDPEGNISRVFPKVKPRGHAALVLDAVRSS